MAGLAEQIESVRSEALAAISAAPDLQSLERVRTSYLGSGGRLTLLMKQLGTLPKEERPAVGKLINSAKADLESLLSQRKEALAADAFLPKVLTDFTMPGRRRVLGRLHPLTQVTEDIVRSFRKLGFVVADGPDVEDDYHCFEALNIPPDHPARDTQDTFYIAGTGGLLLRTHTSPVQVRVMERQRPPVRIIVPGRVY
ncbi:MAG: phenylalanine--tRNA ligase subunit alpha, partial [Verrucomicrobiae bacterium]|nr:phenylalanine--tRNA ligase subunit alpha [Verrucomicrobiae bacterium]